MNYYNENNPKAVQWLRALIEQGSIPAGDIDERNIQDVTSTDLSGYRQCHFFAGIGGWSLALRLAEISDETEIWSMSCPCQPFSVAGQGMGEDDPRHLWPYARNLVGKRRPPIVIGEQVAKKAGFGWLSRVRSDLEASAYAFGSADLCSAGVQAPHNRPRLHWIGVDLMADANQQDRRAGVTGTQTGIGSEGERRGKSGIYRAPDVLGDSSGKGPQTPELEAIRGTRRPEEGGTVGKPSGPQRRPVGAVGNPELLRCDTGKPGDGREQEGTGSPYRPITVRPSRAAVGALADMQHGRRQQPEPAPFTDCDGKDWRVYHGSPAGFWSRYCIALCRDGKARRFEPGSFPLANGFPARMAVITGFGNAINPVLAAEFIQASFEALKSGGFSRG